MSTASKITASATRNKELLSTLSATDHAASGLEQHERYLQDLAEEISTTETKVAELDKKRQKELKQHTRYRDSVIKRFAYKVAGKKDEFAAKADQGERAYFAALQEEHGAREVLRGLKDAEQEARDALPDLEAQAQLHKTAQQQLDQLYEDVFRGASPGFPEEDAAEDKRRAACDKCHLARSHADAQARAVRLLDCAASKTNDAVMALQDALRHSRRDMFGGGSFADMMERNALSKAHASSMEARVAVAQAMRFDPQVAMMPDIHVPQGDLLTDVFFDNFWTDMMFHDKIKIAIAEMDAVKAMVEGQLGAARSRLGALEADVARGQAELERARTELQRVREAVFDRVVGAGDGGSGEAGTDVDVASSIIRSPDASSGGVTLGSNNPFRQL